MRIFCIATIISLMLAIGQPVYAAHLVDTEYTVKTGDTLDSITEMFMSLNDYGPREHNEFKYGIIELNYDILKENELEVAPGMVLEIKYFVKS